MSRLFDGLRDGTLLVVLFFAVSALPAWGQGTTTGPADETIDSAGEAPDYGESYDLAMTEVASDEPDWDRVEELLTNAVKGFQEQVLYPAMRSRRLLLNEEKENEPLVRFYKRAIDYEKSASDARLDPESEVDPDQELGRALGCYRVAAKVIEDLDSIYIGHLRSRGVNPASIALNLYNQILRYQPRNSEILKATAELLQLFPNRETEAIDILERYIATDQGREDSEAHHDLGVLYRETAFTYQALKWLSKARQMDPQNPAVLNDLALAQLKAQKVEESVRTSQLAIDLQDRRVPKGPNQDWKATAEDWRQLVEYQNTYVRCVLESEYPGDALPQCTKMVATARRFFIENPNKLPGVGLMHLALTRQEEVIERLLRNNPREPRLSRLLAGTKLELADISWLRSMIEVLLNFEQRLAAAESPDARARLQQQVINLFQLWKSTGRLSGSGGGQEGQTYKALFDEMRKRVGVIERGSSEATDTEAPPVGSEAP